MGNLVFLNPFLGIISFIIGMIFLFLYYKTKKNARKFKFISDLEEIFGSSKKYFYTNLTLIFLLILTFSLLFANPNLKEIKTKTTRKGIDIALVLDLSYSMVAEDIAPNRLEVAKKVLSDFTSKLKTHRVGLILFSGKPFTSVPLTFDYDFITNYVKNITIKSINQDFGHLQGTAIGDAILYGANLFDNNSDRQKVIVLFTDGEANKGVDPLEAIKYIKDKNIKIHTVGIGGDKDTYVTINNVYGSQKIAIGGVDEKNLKAIANLTSGLYYKADSEKTFAEIFQKLDLLPKVDVEVDKMDFLKDYYKPFVYVIFYLFFIFISFNFYYYLRD
ncbi:MAG: VWA domain-containing protein [Candidatus Gracilibacteria bacterium]|nr:VWA domain-containing protein [Candidatus Gracilibacteria bacterium]